jgi:hypothetical protein
MRRRRSCFALSTRGHVPNKQLILLLLEEEEEEEGGRFHLSCQPLNNCSEMKRRSG